MMKLIRLNVDIKPKIEKMRVSVYAHRFSVKSPHPTNMTPILIIRGMKPKKLYEEPDRTPEDSDSNHEPSNIQNEAIRIMPVGAEDVSLVSIENYLESFFFSINKVIRRAPKTVTSSKPGTPYPVGRF
jgi:hypothetical protein